MAEVFREHRSVAFALLSIFVRYALGICPGLFALRANFAVLPLVRGWGEWLLLDRRSGGLVTIATKL